MSASRIFLAAGAVLLALFTILGAWSSFNPVGWFLLLTGFGVFLSIIFPIAIGIAISILLFAIIAAGIGVGVRRETRLSRTLAQFIKTSFGASLGLGMLVTIMFPWIFVPLAMAVLGDQQRFEGGGVREWLFGKLTLTGRSGQLEPDGKPADYYVSFRWGSASMDYGSRRPAADAVAMFRAFCVKKRLVPSEVEEKANSGGLEITCLPPGQTYIGKFESSYLYIIATPAGTGSHIIAGEMDINY